MRRRALLVVLGWLCVSLPVEAQGAATSCLGKEATIVGTSGVDFLKGTPNRDVVVAGSGNDVVRGRGGRDIICGGRGSDVIRGGKGPDRLYGDEEPRYGSNDRLFGGPGRDFIDFLLADEPYFIPIKDGGDDLVDAGPGRDVIGLCNDGVQRAVVGRRGDDMAVFCEAVDADLSAQRATFRDGAEIRLVGIDDLWGAPYEADSLIGDDDDNFLGPGYDLCCDEVPPADRIEGGEGDDEIWASPGDVVLRGGDGDDSFSDWCCNPQYSPLTYNFEGGSGNDTMTMCSSQGGMVIHYVMNGGPGVDEVSFCLASEADLERGSATQSFGPASADLVDIENLRGSYGDDTLLGDDADNVIFGGAGDDTLDGRGGYDSIDGGRGSDVCLNSERTTSCER